MRWGFRELLEKRAADIIMPDLQKCGGLLEARKIADMAHTYYVPVAPHAVTSPVGMMATARARRRSRARHGFAHQERVTKNVGLQTEFCRGSPMHGLRRVRPTGRSGAVALVKKLLVSRSSLRRNSKQEYPLSLKQEPVWPEKLLWYVIQIVRATIALWS